MHRPIKVAEDSATGRSREEDFHTIKKTLQTLNGWGRDEYFGISILH